MKLNFIDREQELEFLESRYKNGNFEFIVIYGKRRVGKTELIKKFLAGKKHIYFLCDKSGTERNFMRFKNKVAEYLNEPTIETNDPEEVFKNLATKSKEKSVIVFDEFSYLVEKDSSIPSIFQVVIDEILKDTNNMLILCGSSISMMEKGTLSYKSPLYGRKSGHWKVLPMKFKEIGEFFPKNDNRKNIEFWSVLGGIPLYLEYFSDEESVFENIYKQIMNKEGRLYEEIDFILKEELREPDAYKGILTAIGSGKTKVSEISSSSKIKIQDIDKYLKVLIRLGIIEREVPVSESKKTKKAVYGFDDNFFEFWFEFCEPFKSDIEIGDFSKVKDKLKSDFNSYLGRRFEKLITGLIKDKILLKDISFSKIGRQWGKFEGEKGKDSYEIDIVALNETQKEALFGECKWQEGVNALEVVKKCFAKSKFVEWNNEKRKEYFAVFARSFKNKINEFEGKKVYCFDLKDIEKILRVLKNH